MGAARARSSLPAPPSSMEFFCVSTLLTKTTALKNLLSEQILPYWAAEGFDSEAGRFEERLDFAGKAIRSVPLRSMVQCRQIYVFSQAARLGWFEPGLALASEAADRLFSQWTPAGAKDGSGGLAFSIRRDGSVESDARDAYAHAFALFALAALTAATGDTGHLDRADRLLHYMDATLTDREVGGLHDRVPDPPPFKRQNPHMHYLEALLALHEVAPDRGYLARATAIVAMLKQRFLDPETGVLLEYFEPDWSRRASADGRYFEPGHHFEWIWLLDRYDHATGGTRAFAPVADRLWRLALDHGVDARGRVVEEVDTEFAVRLPTHRAWPFTEALKAAAVRHESGDPAAAGFAGTMVDALLGDILAHPFPAGWYDRIDADGRPLVDYIPASTLYHVFLAATEADRVFGA